MGDSPTDPDAISSVDPETMLAHIASVVQRFCFTPRRSFFLYIDEWLYLCLRESGKGDWGQWKGGATFCGVPVIPVVNADCPFFIKTQTGVLVFPVKQP